MSKKMRILSVLLVLMFVLSACSSGGGTSSQGSGAPAEQSGSTAAPSGQSGSEAPASGSSDKTSMVKRALVDQKTYDPFKTNDLNDQIAHYDLYDCLFREEPDGSIVPNLCTDYSFSEDGTELTLTIREGVKFHNGETMTADDVAFSLNTSIASTFTSRMTSTMDHAEKIDDKTVKLVLKHAFAPILNCLVSSNCAIVPQAAYEADPESFATKPIGAGPYTLGEEKTGEKVVFNAFPDYWRGEAAIKELTCRIIPDDAAALMALEAGELDMMQPSQAYTDRQAILDNDDLVYYERPQAVTFGVFFNNAKGPFQDIKLRQAVAYAIDREDLILGAVNGMASPTLAASIPTVPQYPQDFQTREKDIEKAKELMAEAGFADGFTCTMRVIGAANYTKPAEVIQAQLKEIGIDMKIEPLERGTWFDVVMNGGDHELTFYALSVSVIDADFATYGYFHSSQAGGQGMNVCNYSNAEVDKLIEDGRKSQDESERNDIYRKICEIIDEEAAMIPCYTGLRTMAAVQDLKGMYADPMMRYYTYNYSW